MTMREKAIKELMEEAKNHSNNQEMLYQAFRRVGDMDIFALYVEVFGHPVNSTTNNTVEVL